jgi:hypothetical protein
MLTDGRFLDIFPRLFTTYGNSNERHRSHYYKKYLLRRDYIGFSQEIL